MMDKLKDIPLLSIALPVFLNPPEFLRADLNLGPKTLLVKQLLVDPTIGCCLFLK